MSLYEENQLSEQAFQEVNNILDDGGSEVDALNYKVIELQKIITTLTRTNQRLIQRIQDLEEQLEFKNDEEDSTTFNEEYSVIQGNVGDVEEMITTYKAELAKYQQKMMARINQKDSVVSKLEEQVDDLKKTNEMLKEKLDDLQDQNQMLSQTKQNLINEIEELQSSLRKSKVESPRYNAKYTDYSDYTGQYTSDFGMNVQAELEKLIEKLVKQLEHERYLKKKLTEEIKQLQKDMLNQEKELIAKNNKIYSLEITALKKTKVATSVDQRYQFTQAGNKQTPKGREERSRGGRDKQVGGLSSKSRSFTLMELMNQCTILTSKEKLVIALKIIDLYSKKLQRNDFTSEILQSLTICNYNPLSSHLCQVKLNPNVEKDQDNEEDLTESALIWNLIFILDNLLSQTATKDRPFGQSDKEDMLLEAINYYLENRDMNNVDSVMEVRKIVEEALSDQMR